ncbi:hypothetical protein OG322_35405 [Streptomyces sp. NBC_01260]|uniref:hypothetical protein n=1 Tax=unclassified Streptomyces TaxID=2593676 RepID=UPI001607C912|nr:MULTISPECIES: hypothetical protein [unclassified Streptomyces]MCX4774516.1 hypothetical protein [Streptomyces sp. NBC_01285]
MPKHKSRSRGPGWCGAAPPPRGAAPHRRGPSRAETPRSEVEPALSPPRRCKHHDEPPELATVTALLAPASAGLVHHHDIATAVQLALTGALGGHTANVVDEPHYHLRALAES